MSTYAYRRGTIFWALTLIGVGLIFLFQNFNPEVHPWQIIAKFWPVLIIFWGLSKLVDYIQARAHPESAPPSLFSGSEVVLLLLILALGTLVSKLVLHPWQQWPSAFGVNMDNGDFADMFLNPYTFTESLSQPVTGQPHLVVVDRRGDVEVQASDQSALDAVVKKTIRAENEDAAKKLSDEIKIGFVENPGSYALQTNLDSLPVGRAGEGVGYTVSRSVRLDITLRVPRATAAEVTTEHGDIVLDGLRGDETLTSSHGDVHVSGAEGLVRVRASGGSTQIRKVKGSVEIEGRGDDIEVGDVSGTVTVNGDFGGSVEFENVAQTLRFTSTRTNLNIQNLTGRLDMEMDSLDANGVKGPFILTTKHKDVNLDGFQHDVDITNTNGDVRLASEAPLTHNVKVELERGGIELRIPENSSFQIDASSRHGEVETDFSGPHLKISTEGDNPSISGTVGKGGPLIHLSTAYGTIRVVHSEGGENPSPPGHPPSAPKASPHGGGETASVIHRPWPGFVVIAPSATYRSQSSKQFRNVLRTIISNSIKGAIPRVDRSNWNCNWPLDRSHPRRFDSQ
jgi:putative adhesin/cell wall-active antibiotic response 4TMS protein YvqF